MIITEGPEVLTYFKVSSKTEPSPFSLVLWNLLLEKIPFLICDLYTYTLKRRLPWKLKSKYRGNLNRNAYLLLPKLE